MTPALLDACTGCGMEIATQRANDLTVTMNRAEITTPLRQAAFLAQVAHESGGFTCMVEDTNYSAEQMVEFFPDQFDAATAAMYVGRPIAIANRAYANRDGNGDEMSGDGYKYRGRYDMQITGKDDYAAASPYVGVDLVANPGALLGTPNVSLTAGWEWTRSGLNVLADHQDFRAITQKINGGQIGAADREMLYARARAALGLPTWNPLG